MIIDRIKTAMAKASAVEALNQADIDRLTANERRVLGEISIGNDGGHAERTLLSLVAKGWIEPMAEYTRGCSVIRYGMPIASHITWCMWCSEQPCQRCGAKECLNAEHVG
jgi:hypothetical protein